MTIKSLRQELKLTQSQVAERAGISIKLYQKYESGACSTQNMTLGTAIKLAKALNVKAEDLI